MKKQKKIKVIIDMPTSCGECPIGHYYDTGDGWCDLVNYYAKENDIEKYSETGRPDWCPLNNCEVMEE